MSRKHPITQTQAADQPLTPEEEDAYAHIVLLALSQHKQTKDKSGQGDAGGQKSRLPGTSSARGCVRRFLIHWFDGETSRNAMKAGPCSWGDVTAARFSDSDFRAAFEWTEAERPRLLKVAALDVSQRIMDGENVPAHAARLASFILERAARETFGRETSASEIAARAPAVVYNINLTAPAPAKPCDQSATVTVSPSPIAEISQ